MADIFKEDNDHNADHVETFSGSLIASLTARGLIKESEKGTACGGYVATRRKHWPVIVQEVVNHG